MNAITETLNVIKADLQARGAAEVRAVLKTAPRFRLNKGKKGENRFGFAKPIDGGEDIYIPGDICDAAGISEIDIGTVVVIQARPSPKEGFGPVAWGIRRDAIAGLPEDMEIDEYDETVLRRLDALDAKMNLLISMVTNYASKEES